MSRGISSALFICPTGAVSMNDTSLAVMILERARRYGSKRVFQRKRGSRWEDIAWQQFGEQIVYPKISMYTITAGRGVESAGRTK